ncbi:MAG TPA: FtsX-like permease family protein [Gammaproteobacteria bacterium]|nr:FtsX-like permease family protein [Gammaproteobacteria bacterium]
MRAWRFATRSFVRGLRAGRLTILMVALTVAVAAITSIGFFIDRVRASVAQEAAGLLAADLRENGSDPLNPDDLKEAQRRGLRTAEVTSFPTVVVAGDASQLASLYAVSESYPLRGQVRLSDSVGATSSYVVAGAPPAGAVWVEDGLLARLNADVGARVSIGAREFAVERVLEHRPDQSLGFDTFAPSLMMNLADLASTELIRPGSRATYSQLFAGDAAQVAAFKDWFESTPERRLQTAGRSEERIDRAIDRAERFLSLASMIALLLAATAVAVSARRYAAQQVEGVALLKCLGASQALVLAATLLELALIGVATGIAGSALGYLAQLGLGSLVEDLMELTLPAPGLTPGVSGVFVALAVLAGFASPAMLNLRTVPPLRVLHQDAAPKAVPTAVSYGAAAAAVLGLLAWLVGTDEMFVVSVVGLGLGAVLLYAAAHLLVRLIEPLRSGAGVAWRYGLANIARRRADSVAQVMAFGFGLTVLLLLSGVRTSLLDTWYASLPTDAPNNFMINIQPEEADGVRALFEEYGQEAPKLVPMVRGRLTQIDGEDVMTRRMRGEGGWLFREANLTWAEELDATNEIVAGEWWAPGTEGAEISVEEGIMQGLGLTLGDELTFEVGGFPLTATLTSVRRVEWDSLSPNFMLVLNPAALKDYPATFVASTYAPNRDVMLELVRRFPSITVIDLASVLEQVRSIMDRAALAIQYVFLFTLLAGVVVLLAAVQATREERRFEVALLRTLGASRRRVLAALVVEFASLGVLAGALAALIASGVAYWLATRVFQLDFTFDPIVVGAGLVAGGVLVGLSGTLATYSVVRQPPAGVLAQAS